MRTVDTLIIGGGLAGLNAARKFAKRCDAFNLLEARDRLGGRILTRAVAGSGFDMGPAWFWPDQPRMAALVRDLGLTVFEQYATGDFIYEDSRGALQRGRGGASMQGALRVAGGMATLLKGMADGLPPDTALTEHQVRALHHTGQHIMVETAAGAMFSAQRVILTTPPRVAAERITFSPPLPKEALSAMRATPTWMAGHAKAMAVYDAPFWRHASLSGDAISHMGPLVEIHDASPQDAGPFALFGFVGVPAHNRRDEGALKDAIQAQLTRLFGPAAAAPVSLMVKDWATDPFTATDLDAQPLHAHPSYGHPDALRHLWNGRLTFAGTEVAPEFGGYLEGALAASDAAVDG